MVWTPESMCFNVLMVVRFEATFGRSAYAHLFVTKAMQDYLVREWGLMCVVSIVFVAHN